MIGFIQPTWLCGTRGRLVDTFQHNVDPSLSKKPNWTLFPVVDRRKVLMKICDVLKYLHDHRIIHLDLKPGNILLKSNGEESYDLENFKLTDFGFSRNNELTTITRGTPGWS